jgi:lysyl-tRNA synthetase class 1
MVGYAVAYFRDSVRPAKTYATPDDVEVEALTKLDAMFAALPPGASA